MQTGRLATPVVLVTGPVWDQVDWQKRIEALARCEGIVLGGGAQWGNFVEVLRNQLRDLLSLQIGDRCALQPLVDSRRQNSSRHGGVLLICWHSTSFEVIVSPADSIVLLLPVLPGSPESCGLAAGQAVGSVAAGMPIAGGAGG